MPAAIDGDLPARRRRATAGQDDRRAARPPRMTVRPSLEGRMPKLPGKPMAMPDPPVTSRCDLASAPSARRSASAIASATISLSPLRSARLKRRLGGSRPQCLPAARCPTLSLRLPRQPAPDVGVGHRRQRMLLHAGLVQQAVADEQMALIERAAVGGKGRAHKRQRRAELFQQRFGHRADISLRRRIEGRAIFEDDLLGAILRQASGTPPATAPPPRLLRSSGSSARRPPHRSFRPSAARRECRHTGRCGRRPWQACWRCRRNR